MLSRLGRSHNAWLIKSPPKEVGGAGMGTIWGNGVWICFVIQLCPRALGTPTPGPQQASPNYTSPGLALLELSPFSCLKRVQLYSEAPS